MIDFSSCDKIDKYLEKGQYDKLKKFVDAEREKYYLGIVAGALKKYTKTNSDPKNRFLYGYLDEKDRDLGTLLISDSCSVYFLNSDVLSPSFKEGGLEVKPDSDIDELLKLRNKWKFQSFYTGMYRQLLESAADVERIEKERIETWTNVRSAVLMSAQGRTITHHFSTYEFSFTELFLGTGCKSDIKYKLCSEQPIYFAESPRGKCLVIGLRTNQKSKD